MLLRTSVTGRACTPTERHTEVQRWRTSPESVRTLHRAPQQGRTLGGRQAGQAEGQQQA